MSCDATRRAWWPEIPVIALVAALALAASPAGAQQPAASIAGEWEGMYRYDDVKRFTALVPFTLELKQEGTTVRGRVTEPRSDFGPNDKTLGSNLAGSYEAESGSFIFRKIYDYDGHVVHYSGAVDRAGTLLSGTWRIGTYTGTWFARRRP